MMPITAVLIRDFDGESPEQHQRRVLRELAPLLSSVDSSLKGSIPSAHNFFSLSNGSFDGAVHASNTRYLVKLALREKKLDARDEEDAFELKPASNCGLFLGYKNYDVRILKSGTDGSVPKPSSDARRDFFSRNQRNLPFFTIEGPSPRRREVAVILWRLNNTLGYGGYSVAFPKGSLENGDVECHWLSEWSIAPMPLKASPLPDDTDLDEIRPKSE
jgi:hypothetical protein